MRGRIALGFLIAFLFLVSACGAPRPGVTPTLPEQPVQATPNANPEPLSAAGLAPGQEPPTFRLPLLGGGTASLDDYLGRPLLINFWATWCPPCREEMPAIQRAYERYRSQEFTVLAINFQEDEEAVRAFVEDFGLTFPILLDRTGDVTMTYRVLGLPTSIFVARDGRIHKVRIGAMSEAFLEETLAEVLKR